MLQGLDAFQGLDVRVGGRSRATVRPVVLVDPEGPETGQLSWDAADLAWAPAAAPGRGRRIGRRGGPRKGLLARLRGQDALALLDAGPDAVVAVDASNRVVLYNRGAEALFGHRGPDVMGQSADLLVAPAARGVLALLRQQVLDGARPGPGGEAVEVAGLRQDGTGFPAAIWLSRVETRDGDVVAAVIRDVSERRAAQARAEALAAQLSESRDTVAAVLRAVSDRVVIIAAADGRITAFNRAAERMLGYAAEEIIGRSTLCLSDAEDVAAAVSELGIEPGLDPLLEITRSGLPNMQEWTYLTKTGERRPVSLRITAVGDRRNPTGFVCVANDLTLGWQPVTAAQPSADRLLLELDDAPTRTLRWQVGGSGFARRR